MTVDSTGQRNFFGDFDDAFDFVLKYAVGNYWIYYCDDEGEWLVLDTIDNCTWKMNPSKGIR